MDERKDSTQKEILTMNIRCFYDGKFIIRFLGLIELHKDDRLTIYESLSGSLKAMGIYRKN